MDIVPKTFASLVLCLCFFITMDSARGSESLMTDARSKALVQELKDLVASDAASKKITIKTHDGAYSAKLYTRPDDKASVVISLVRGSDKDVEVPRIGTILVKGKAVSPATGDFEFASKPDEQTPVIIFFDRSTSATGVSKKTRWPAKGKMLNQSIGVAGGKGKRPGLNPGDWPCEDSNGNDIPKTVSLSDADTIWFYMCPNNGQTLTYGYEIRMRQRGTDNVEADVGIDPLIYNHP
jgi:hypothetical protein